MMVFLVFLVVMLIGYLLVLPLIMNQLKKTGTVSRPHQATIIGGALIGAAVSFSPIGDWVWIVLLHSNIGLSPYSSLALKSAITFPLGFIVAMYIEALIRKRDPKN